MTKRRAFWEALATVGIPTLLVWGGLGYFFRVRLGVDGLLGISFFSLLPLLLFFPIYGRYKKGLPPGGRERTPKYYFVSGVAFILLAAAYVALALSHNRDSLELASRVALALAWFAVGIDYLRRAKKLKANLSSGDIAS